MRSRLSSAALSVGFTLLIVGFLASRVDWRRFLDVVASVRAGWIVVLVASTVVDRVWMAGKWHYLLHNSGVPVRFGVTLRHYFLGGILGAAVQWQVAGDVARAMGLGGTLDRRRDVIASVAVERFTGAAASGLLATVGLLALSAREGSAAFLSVGVVLSMFAAVLPVFVLRRRAYGVLSALTRHLWTPLATKISSATSYITTQLPSTGVFVRFYSMTLGEQAVPMVNMFLLAKAFSIDVRITDIIIIMPIIGFFSRLPIAVESIGLKEGLYMYLFGSVGILPEEAIAASLCSRVIDALVLSGGCLATLVTRWLVGAPAEEPAGPSESSQASRG